MPEYTKEEAREQVLKAGRYFSRVLREHEAKYIAARVNGCTVVIVRERDGGPFERFAENEGFNVEKPQARGAK